ncbi:hypothetical protein F441_04674, partial [Phytophthora nicotianae CJ01A1]
MVAAASPGLVAATGVSLDLGSGHVAVPVLPVTLVGGTGRAAATLSK